MYINQSIMNLRNNHPKNIIKNGIFPNLSLDICKYIFGFLNSPLLDDIYNSKNDIYIHLGIYKKVKEDCSFIRKIMNPTIELYYLVITNSLHFAKYIPQEILVLLFQEISPNTIHYIKPQYQTEDMILIAISKNIKLIKSIHPINITEKVNNYIIKYMCDHSLCIYKKIIHLRDDGEKIEYENYQFILDPNTWNISNYLNFHNLNFQNKFYSCIIKNYTIYTNNSHTLNENTKIKNIKRFLQKQNFNKIKIRG